MKKKIKQILILTAICIMGFTSSLSAQTSYKLATGPEVFIKVLGSSNVHDWVMTTATMESQGNFKLGEGNQLRELTGFSFSLNAKTLKSEHESMDTRTYKTIKADQYPKITYKLISAVITTVQKNKYLVKTSGDLTIAGTTKPVTLDVEFGGIVVDPYGQTKAGFTVTGKISRKEFGLTMSPVTDAGSVVVGDEIKINAEVQLIKQA